MRQPAKEATLHKFYEDKDVYFEVQEYFLAHLDQLGLQKVYAKEDSHGVADARLVIENAFKQLDEMFGAKDKKKKIVNESR